jgi:hypothetical protein
MSSRDDIIDAVIRAYHELYPGHSPAELMAFKCELRERYRTIGSHAKKSPPHAARKRASHR